MAGVLVLVMGFGLAVPTKCPGVPGELLDPRSTMDDGDAHDAAAADLARPFVENIPGVADQASEEIVAAGPNVD